MNTFDLAQELEGLTDDVENLIANIPEDSADDAYQEAVEELASWLGVEEPDHLEFFGTQPWATMDFSKMLEEWGRSDEAARITQIEELRREIGAYEFDRGVELIDRDNREDHAQERAKDTARLSNRDFDAWPFNHIDWAAAADDLLGDYREVEFDGETYYYEPT